MKILRLLFLIILTNNAFGQESAISFLLNKGTVTYIDNSKNLNYSVSFKGDTVVQIDELKNVYMVDTTMVQISKYPIPEKMQKFKYDSKKESKLLKHFMDYEFDYTQKEIYARKMKCYKEFFSNNNSKRFLLWYFKVPDDTKAESSKPAIVKKSTTAINFVVKYQAFLAFTTGFYVIMINIPIFNNEILSDKLESIKSDIANTIRVYDGNININALNNQLDYNINHEPFIINDSVHGIQFTVPFWLNIMEYESYALIGTFPDIDNISNAMLLNFYDKSKFGSFKSFKDQMLLKESTKGYERIDFPNEKMERYKSIYKSDHGNYFTCQYVFINLGDYYGFLNFTATASTYDRNIQRFNEFVENIKLKSSLSDKK